MDQIIAVDSIWYAIVQRTCMMNLAKALESWIAPMKRIILPLERSKSSFTVTAVKVRNKDKVIIGTKEEIR